MPAPTSNSDFNPLGRIAGLVGLLAIGLYFTGWVYRWAYFGRFKIQVTSLGLPVESFYLAAFRALFGDPLIILKTVSAFILVTISIFISLQGVRSVARTLIYYLRTWKLISRMSSFQQQSFKFLLALIHELVIIFGLLTTLFCLAVWQADHDAWTDVVNETSELPIVTAVIHKDIAVLGGYVNDPIDYNLFKEQFVVIGDPNLYEKVLGHELNDTSNPDKLRQWRLLTDREGYFYMFPALPDKDQTRWPPVLKIYESGNGDQLTILGPNYEIEAP